MLPLLRKLCRKSRFCLFMWAEFLAILCSLAGVDLAELVSTKRVAIETENVSDPYGSL